MAPRISESELARLKRDISVQRLVERSGIVLAASGKVFVGICPFHADALRSLTVEPVSNAWCCSSCNAAGGPVEWVAKKNGVSARHAVELLREGVGMLATPTPVKRNTVRVLEGPFAADADDRVLFNQVIDYYHQRLKQSPEALAYLEARGIGGHDAIDTFKLGFADRSLGLRLPNNKRKHGRSLRSQLVRLGLYRDSGHEHLNGAVVFPVLDVGGTAVHAYGRKIGTNLNPGTVLHLELPPPYRGVFNEQALAVHSEIILCKGVVDALTFWCAGYQNVTCTHGARDCADELLEAFKRHRVTRVLLAFDRTTAGDRTAQTAADRLMAAGIECFRISYPKGMDANAFARHSKSAPKSLGEVIRSAAWIGKGVAPVPAAAPPRVAEPTTLPDVEAGPARAVEEPAMTAQLDALLDEGEPDDLLPLEEETGPAVAVEEPRPAVMTAVLAALLDEDDPDMPDMPDEPPPLPASPMPTPVATDIAVGMAEHEVTLQLGDRRYRVRGLGKNLTFEVLKVNLMVARGEAFYVDALDLYSAKQRASFIAAAAFELHIKDAIIRTDLGRVLLKLEQLQDEAIAKALQPKEPPTPTMTDAERDAALALLRDPGLMQRIAEGFAVCGLIGEEVNKLVGYLASVSRKLDKPLGVVIQSSSAAGKTALMDAVLAFVPDEEKVKYSAMTGQSLFYMGVSPDAYRLL